MIQAYVDESGGKGQTKTFVVSALIGESMEWAAIADGWNRVLGKSPKIGYFKMDEAEGIEGQFYGFTSAERDAKVKELCDVIANPAITEVSLTVHIDDFLKIWAPRLGRPASEPYFFPFQMIHVAIAYELLERGHAERCEVFFDENKIFGPRAKIWYPVIRRGFPEEIQSILPIEPFFRDDKDILPLQAADLTAWIQRTYSCNNDSLGEFEWILDSLKGIVESPYSKILDRKWFAEMANDRGRNEGDLKQDIMEAYKEAFGFEWPPKTKIERKRHSGR